MNEEIINLRKRLEQLEELLPTIKDFPLKHSYVKTFEWKGLKISIFYALHRHQPIEKIHIEAFMKSIQ